MRRAVVVIVAVAAAYFVYRRFAKDNAAAFNPNSTTKNDTVPGVNGWGGAGVTGRPQGGAMPFYSKVSA